MRSNHTAFSSKKRNISTYCVQTYVNVMVSSSRAPRIEPHHVSDQHKKSWLSYHIMNGIQVTWEISRMVDSRCYNQEQTAKHRWQPIPSDRGGRTYDTRDVFYPNASQILFSCEKCPCISTERYVYEHRNHNKLSYRVRGKWGGGGSDGQGAYKIFIRISPKIWKMDFWLRFLNWCIWWGIHYFIILLKTRK